ncbi:MAG TPA: amidohydrolase family protein, partial [Draconibacterium sp.]|nr:amidohydrolase family protein [Draconibacterium sp.]
MRLFRVLILILVMASCTRKVKVDLIVRGGWIYTVDEDFSTVESFAVKDGKILAIGTTQEIRDQYDADKVVDAEGQFVYPGFNDAHCHFNGYAVNLMQYADLRGTESSDEIYALLKEHHDKFGGNWILGRSWDQNDWEDTSFPDKTILDEFFHDIPVYLIRVDGHAAWCNSKAMELAGISADTKVQGGEVLLKNGEPTGILIDNAMGFVAKLIPEITPEQQQKGLLEAQKN